MMIHYIHSLEKTVDIFGYLFSNIHIRRWDSQKTNKEDLLVPVEFNGKEHMFYLLKNKMQNEEIKVESVFPRIGYNVNNITYDPARMTNREYVISADYREHMEVERNRIPYNVEFELNIAAVHKTDLFMILEQILPWFRPSLTIKANLNPYIGDDKSDVSVVLKENEFKNYGEEAPFSNSQEQLLVYTLKFDVKTWLYSLNHEDSEGHYPYDDGSGIGKSIKEIELGATYFNDTRDVKDNSLYNIHYPEHLN